MDLLDKGFIQGIIADIETSQNRDRRENEIKAFEAYSGNLKQHVINRLAGIYPKTYKSFSIADLNLSKKITDKLSMAYKKSPIRELDSDTENEEYSALMKDIDASKAWQAFDVYYNLHRYAAMWFSYIGEGEQQRIVLRPLAPFQFSRVVDSVGRTELFVVNFPTNDFYETYDTDGMKSMIQDSEQDSGCSRYAIWSKDQHVVVRVYEEKTANDKAVCRIEYEAIDGNENNENPLSVIPAVFAQQGDSAALPILNPLTSQTIEFNQQYSVMLTGASLQTFGHLVLKHPEDQKMPDEIYNSLFTYSRLPQKDGDISTDLDYLNPSPNITGQLELISNYGHQIITEHLGDGAQNVKGSDNFTSGLDRMIAMSDISNTIESNQQVYANAENQLYKIIQAFYEQANDLRFKSESLTVKYSKAKPIQSEKELLENIKIKLDLGLIEKYEALIELDPNMSTDAAKEKIDKVKEEKKDQVNTLMGAFSANQQEQS